ncbi:serine hydrolase [Georgenia sp. 10Sc9-8]|uniref:Serine hydrolase n=1 Tax=Georgenia halotolerans TaxID=3028317 RepID=A0ABT5U483_9MICO|nr:serine hydrolase [Georgenia halotolerans]
MRRRSVAALGAVVGMGLAACGVEEPSPDPASSAPATEDSAPATEETGAEQVEIPDTAVGRAAQWALDQVAMESGPSAAEAAARFAPVFLEQVPAGEVEAVFEQLRAMGPFTPTSYTAHGNSAQAELRTGQGGRMLLNVSVDDAELIQGLFLQPVPDIPDIEDAADAAAVVAEAAPRSAFLLAEMTEDGTCEPVRAVAEDELLPVGSIFKLYVLGAVVDAVAAGDLSWGDTLTLTEESRSLPSGTLHEEPDGTEVSVREAAEAAVAISDNTATDLLIAAVGRDRVEQVQADLGHSAPEVNTPFLTTREMFQLTTSDPELRASWTDATGAEPLSTDPAVSERQRQLIEELPDWDRELDEDLTSQVAWPDGLDWFATAEDLCAGHARLQDLAGTPAGEPVRDILAQNPGLATEDLAYVGYKGGSAVGEIAGSWYVETDDGDRYVLVIQLAGTDPAQVPDGGWLSAVATDALAGLADD